jgi:flagellar hook-length control protein FliK
VAQPATFAPVAELAKKELAKAEKPESDVLADEAPLAIVINLPSPVIVPVAIAVPIEPAPAETKAASPTTASVDSGASHPVSPAPGLAIATEGGKGDASSDQGDSAKEAAFQAPAPTAEDAEPGAAPAPAPAREAAPVLATALAQPTAPAEHAAKIPIATITAQPGRIGQELGVAIAHHVASGSAATGGGETITLRLNPVDMGRIEVKLSFDDSGTLRAVVSADTPAALDMLRRDSADLGRALSDAGVRADTQTLRFDTRAGDGQRGQANDNGPAWQRPQDGRSGSTIEAGSDVAEDITAYRPLRTRGGVDMVA